MRRMLSFGLVGFVLCNLMAVRVQAQDASSFLELMRQDIKAEKAALITEAMDFSEEEAGIFWPLYREYEFESDKLGDQRIEIIRDYANAYDSMTDDIAKDLIERSFKVREKQLKLNKSTWKTLSKKLSPIVAARFTQVNNQINDLIDLQIASELPLVEATGSSQ